MSTPIYFSCMDDNERLAIAFGKALRELRTKKNLSQGKVVIAANHDFTIITYQRYDAGKRIPKIPMLIRIARAFKVSPSTILNLALSYYEKDKQ